MAATAADPGIGPYEIYLMQTSPLDLQSTSATPVAMPQ